MTTTAVDPVGACHDTDDRHPLKVAYVVSRFPKLTETFVLYELIALEALGVAVEIYPLLRARQRVTHPEAEQWTRRARFHPFFSFPILAAQLHFLRRSPRAYLSLLLDVLRQTWGSPNFFIGAIGIFPKSVRFAYEMARDGVTHIHAHFANHPTVAAFIINRLTGIPFSFTAHAFDLHVDRRMLDTKVAAAAFAVTISEYNKRLMLSECGEAAAAKIHVIHCGVDIDVFDSGPYEPNAGSFRIICVGSLEERKGHQTLLDACAFLHERGVDFVCDVIGEGPMRSILADRIAQLGLGDRVCLLGGKPRPEVVRMLRAADVAVLVSQSDAEGKSEGIPVVLMEAMASRLPVVASDISGIPELVAHGHTGFLVPPRHPTALADALECLARDAGLRRRLGEAGREKISREFDLRTNVTELLMLMLPSRETPNRGALPYHTNR